MIPDIYIREKLVLEHRHQLFREAEQERLLAGLPEHSSHVWRRLVARLVHRQETHSGMVVQCRGERPSAHEISLK